MGRKIVEVVGKMSAVKGAHLFILPVKNVQKELKEDGTLTKLSKMVRTGYSSGRGPI